jgi:uncharacterized protein
VADRGGAEASCSEWHGDGTAGEDDRGSGLVATVLARAMGEARPWRHEPRWQAPLERAAASATLARAMDRTEAVQLLGRLHAAQGAFYAGGEEAPVRALLTDDIHWHVPGRNAIAGDYHGVDAVLAYFRRRRDLADRTFRMHPGDVLAGDGDRIAALTDGTAMIGGVERSWSTVGLYEVRDGRVAACWLLPLDPDSFDEIWADSGR